MCYATASIAIHYSTYYVNVGLGAGRPIKTKSHVSEDHCRDVITVLASTTVDLYFLHNFHLDSSEVV